MRILLEKRETSSKCVEQQQVCCGESFFKNKTIDRCGRWVDWVPGVDGLAGAVKGAG